MLNFQRVHLFLPFYYRNDREPYKAFAEMYVKLYVKCFSINETLHMLKKNIPATSLKIVCKNLDLVKCYDKTNMKLFALSLWEISAEPFSLFHHGLLI